MGTALRTVRLIHGVMLVSVVAYVVVGEVVKIRNTPEPTILYALSFVSISVVGSVLVVRRTLVHQSEAQLLQDPGNPAIVNRWKVGHIVSFALCEALGLFGLVLRILGFQISHVWPYYAGACVLLLLFWPRAPRGIAR